MFIDCRERGSEKGREKKIDVRQEHWVAASHVHPGRDGTLNLDMGLDLESNPQPFGV